MDQWGRESRQRLDRDRLIDFEHQSPSAPVALPRSARFAPIFLALGAGEVDPETRRSVIEGRWHELPKRSIQIG